LIFPSNEKKNTNLESYFRFGLLLIAAKAATIKNAKKAKTKC
jgi:hypothetical protein